MPRSLPAWVLAAAVLAAPPQPDFAWGAAISSPFFVQNLDTAHALYHTSRRCQREISSESEYFSRILGYRVTS